MANEIKKALEEAVEKAEQEQQAPQLNARVKKLLARKQRQQRQKHNPNRPRK